MDRRKSVLLIGLTALILVLAWIWGGEQPVKPMIVDVDVPETLQ